METKGFIALEVKKGDFTFSFNMPTGSTWGSALDASFEIQMYVAKMCLEAAEKNAPKSQEDSIEPEVVA